VFGLAQKLGDVFTVDFVRFENSFTFVPSVKRFNFVLLKAVAGFEEFCLQLFHPHPE